MAMDTPPSFPPALWDPTPPDLEASIRALEARLRAWEALAARRPTWPAQVCPLEEPLNPSSRTAWRPPWSEPPPSARPKRPRRQRRCGAQPGHPGHPRRLMPVEEVDAVGVLKPDPGSRGHALLWAQEATPFRHRVLAIPSLPPVETASPWPQGVPSGPYGPCVPAPVALCPGSSRLSKGMPTQGIQELFRVPKSGGPMRQCEPSPSEGLAEPVA
jgi:Family of unknown function (DUF6444)